MVKIRQMAPLYEIKLLNRVNRHIQHTLVLMCAKKSIFRSFLDIRQNAEWPRFLDHPVQCESKIPPPKVFWHFPQTFANFSTKFYVPITRSHLR